MFSLFVAAHDPFQYCDRTIQVRAIGDSGELDQSVLKIARMSLGKIRVLGGDEASSRPEIFGPVTHTGLDAISDDISLAKAR